MTFWKLLICIYLFVNKVGLNIFLVLLFVVRCVKNQMIQFASFVSCFDDFFVAFFSVFTIGPLQSAFIDISSIIGSANWVDWFTVTFATILRIIFSYVIDGIVFFYRIFTFPYLR